MSGRIKAPPTSPNNRLFATTTKGSGRRHNYGVIAFRAAFVVVIPVLLLSILFQFYQLHQYIATTVTTTSTSTSYTGNNQHHHDHLNQSIIARSQSAPLSNDGASSNPNRPILKGRLPTRTTSAMHSLVGPYHAVFPPRTISLFLISENEGGERPSSEVEHDNFLRTTAMQEHTDAAHHHSNITSTNIGSIIKLDHHHNQDHLTGWAEPDHSEMSKLYPSPNHDIECEYRAKPQQLEPRQVCNTFHETDLYAALRDEKLKKRGNGWWRLGYELGLEHHQSDGDSTTDELPSSLLLKVLRYVRSGHASVL
jgi:hypothetical protein